MDFLGNVTFEEAIFSFCSLFQAIHVARVQVQIDAWFSSDGVTADTHYDTLNNLYMVVQGKKTFQLAPPSHHPLFPLHPSLHAAYRQVQVTSSLLAVPNLTVL